MLCMRGLTQAQGYLSGYKDKDISMAKVQTGQGIQTAVVAQYPQGHDATWERGTLK